MARVHVTSCFLRAEGDERVLNEYRRLMTCAGLDRFGLHETAGRPEDADVIIFAELANHGGHVQRRVLADEVYGAFAARSVVFNPRLKEPPIIAGIYGSAVRGWCAAGHAMTSHYLETTLERDYIAPAPFEEADYLFSFCGSAATWEGRGRILALKADDAFLVDSRKNNGLSPEQYRMRYVRSLAESKFVLCPRGVGPASLRLFEVLKAGRVPVVVADDWVAPPGPEWDSFSIRIPEADILQIPAILRNHEPHAAQMAERALRAHAEWFAADVSYHRIVDWALDIQKYRDTPAARRHRRRLRRRHRAHEVLQGTRRLLRRARS